MGHALRLWVEAIVGDDWGADPVAVAKCAHCDDVVFSVDGGWVLAEMTTMDPVDGAPLGRSRIRHFSNVRAVLDAMDAHDVPH